ncbi:MAG: hypothetical protein ABIK59_03385 [candidate division WOR-3 bacterium]
MIKIILLLGVIISLLEMDGKVRALGKASTASLLNNLGGQAIALLGRRSGLKKE